MARSEVSLPHQNCNPSLYTFQVEADKAFAEEMQRQMQMEQEQQDEQQARQAQHQHQHQQRQVAFIQLALVATHRDKVENVCSTW